MKQSKPFVLFGTQKGADTFVRLRVFWLLLFVSPAFQENAQGKLPVLFKGDSDNEGLEGNHIAVSRRRRSP